MLIKFQYIVLFALLLLTWEQQNETPGMVWNVYSSFDLSVPLLDWPLLATVTNKSFQIEPIAVAQFFAITASNQFGESDFATK